MKKTDTMEPFLEIKKKCLTSYYRQKITSSVELRHTASHSVGVKFFSECGTAAEGDRLETSLCRGLRPGTPVRFQVQLQVITCPVGRDLNESFDIYPVGVNEALTVQLQVSCQCPCDQVDNAVKVGELFLWRWHLQPEFK